LAKVVVVDDDPVLQMTVARVLEQAEALDLFMPGGFETMRRVLQQRPDLPIITMSERPRTPDPTREPDYPTMATKLGAVHALPEPFKPTALLAMAADRLTLLSPSTAQSRPDRDAVSNS
jgi:CheY-like chemotaxis protein